MTNRRCIVTGGCGFIGSALVRHLCREGREVLVVDTVVVMHVESRDPRPERAHEAFDVL